MTMFLPPRIWVQVIAGPPPQIVAVAGCNGIHAEVIAGDGVHGSLRETLDQYLKLLDWTGRQIRKDKVGAIPKDCAPILERLECSAETWVDFVKNFRKRFRNEAGLPKTRQTFRTTRRASRSSVKAF